MGVYWQPSKALAWFRVKVVMLFMVIENFRHEAAQIGERFESKGRMLPEGVTYHHSWIDTVGGRCFQLMEASDEKLLKPWVSRWDDLIDFEIIPVVTSAEFWSKARSSS